MMPFSPYDCDNHVVTEYYDKDYKKWIMLDPSTNVFYVDKRNIPLSILDIRDYLILNKVIYPVCLDDTGIDKNILFIDKKLGADEIANLEYIAKNMFWFAYSSKSTFGIEEDCVGCFLVPQGFKISTFYSLNALLRKYMEIPIKKTDFSKAKNQAKNDYEKNISRKSLEVAPK